MHACTHLCICSFGPSLILLFGHFLIHSQHYRSHLRQHIRTIKSKLTAYGGALPMLCCLCTSTGCPDPTLLPYNWSQLAAAPCTEEWVAPVCCRGCCCQHDQDKSHDSEDFGDGGYHESFQEYCLYARKRQAVSHVRHPCMTCHDVHGQQTIAVDAYQVLQQLCLMSHSCHMCGSDKSSKHEFMCSH